MIRFRPRAAVCFDARRAPFGPSLAQAVCDQVGCGQDDGLALFFGALFAPTTASVKQLAQTLGVNPTTLISRFYRADLPSPKAYLVHARLCWLAHLLVDRRLTLSEAAVQLGASSEQHLCRHVKQATRLRISQFRRHVTAALAFGEMQSNLIRPHLDTLRQFNPIAEPDRSPRPRAVMVH